MLEVLQAEHEILAQAHEKLVVDSSKLSQELGALQKIHMSVVEAQDKAQHALSEMAIELARAKQDLLSAKDEIVQLEASRDAINTTDAEEQVDEADWTDSDTSQSFVSAGEDTEPSGRELSTPPTSPLTETEARCTDDCTLFSTSHGRSQSLRK